MSFLIALKQLMESSHETRNWSSAAKIYGVEDFIHTAMRQNHYVHEFVNKKYETMYEIMQSPMMG